MIITAVRTEARMAVKKCMVKEHVGFVLKECKQITESAGSGVWVSAEEQDKVPCAFMLFPSLLLSQTDPSCHWLPFDVGTRKQLFMSRKTKQ